MTVDLKQYHEQLDQLSPEIRATLDATAIEAGHVMSPAGLKQYLDGAVALARLGRGNDLVISYLQAMPAVVKDLGETAIGDAVGAALKFSSLTSGAVVALVFSTLPVAARRLGDGQLLRDYLALLHQLASKAPRGLRPMLDRLDVLLHQLTLGGLRRWALWGAQVHARDFEALVRYFDLQSADSQAVLQKERRGTLFVDLQRRLNFYLRALWGRDFFMRPTSGDFESREGYKPFIERTVIHLPDAYDDLASCPAPELYRAAAAHAAAHMMYTRQRLSAEALTPVQMAFIGLFEDARVEHLAIREFPGLKAVWSRLHTAQAEDDNAADALDLMARAARAMLDDTYRDADAWVQEAAAAFRERAAADANDNQLSWDLGVTFYNRLKARMPIPPVNALEKLAIPYRDDNRFIWEFDENVWDPDADVMPWEQGQVRRHVSVMEMVNEVDNELAGDDAQEVWILDSEFYRDGDPVGVSMNQLEGKEPTSEPYHYDEWDYQVQLARPDWVTVYEKRLPAGSAEEIDAALEEHRPLARRLQQLIEAAQPRGLQRLRKQEDGDQLDLDAAIRAMVDVRMGQTPDQRVNIRLVRKVRDLAVLVLLDLSESTNETPAGADRPIIQLAREATSLLGWAMQGIGDPFALHGFASNGRHDVEYYRFKDFDQPYDDKAKARLAGMRGGLSTRMGGALRHAASFLRRQPQTRKLVLLITDGEPADIDVRDPQYLRHDTKKAVEELATGGIHTFCMSLDPHADDYVSRLFGPKGYMVVDRVQRLPEKLPMLYMGLTR
jgi:hypothetical protein